MKRFLSFPRLSMIFLGVFGVMFYAIFKHRKSKGAPRAPSTG